MTTPRMRLASCVLLLLPGLALATPPASPAPADVPPPPAVISVAKPAPEAPAAIEAVADAPAAPAPEPPQRSDAERLRAPVTATGRLYEADLLPTSIRVGDQVVVRVRANPEAGDDWQFRRDNLTGFLPVICPREPADAQPPVPGAVVDQRFCLRAILPGSGLAVLERRSTRGAPVSERVQVYVGIRARDLREAEELSGAAQR
jgi:hypothetical protein